MNDMERIAHIRSRRAERAGRKLNAAVAESDLAREAALEADDEIRAYSEETRTLEFDLLSQLVDRNCTLADIRDVQAQLDIATAHAKRLVERAAEARDTLILRERGAEHARAKRAAAERKLTKITELNSVLRDARSKERQAAEDAELDAFSDCMPRGGGRVFP